MSRILLGIILIRTYPIVKHKQTFLRAKRGISTVFQAHYACITFFFCVPAVVIFYQRRKAYSKWLLHKKYMILDWRMAKVMP